LRPPVVRLANEILPPVVLRMWRRVRRPRYGFFGSYKTYDEAAAAAGGAGYSDAAMVHAIVRNQGERNAVPRSVELEDRWLQLQLGLSHALARTPDGELRVLDFGGAAGTHYFDVVRWREHTGWPRGQLRWQVCETAAMVAAAQPALGGEELSFHASLDELENEAFDLVYVSGSLQYVPDSEAIWDRLAALPHSWLVLNRTPFIPASSDFFAVQRVIVPGAGRATYPGRFLAEGPWLRRIGRTHDLIVQWPERGAATYVQARRDVRYGGMLLKRR
jgi:putative methyltransferase (TIGR04325 family)